MSWCPVCDEKYETSYLRTLDTATVCPRCYKILTFEVLRRVRALLEDVADEYGITPEDVWEVYAREVDIMPEAAEVER